MIQLHKKIIGVHKSSPFDKVDLLSEKKTLLLNSNVEYILKSAPCTRNMLWILHHPIVIIELQMMNYNQINIILHSNNR